MPGMFLPTKENDKRAMNNICVACIFDDCDELANYALTARWQDGQVRRREVCLVHRARGVQSLQAFRDDEAGEPTISQIALN